MARKVDLSNFSMNELKQLKKEVEAAIKGFADKRRAEARKALEAVAKEHGLTVDEIVGGRGRKRGAKAPPKYANPGNPGQTWSGRGRQPAWFKAAIAAGKKPESLEI